jgi:S-DNA-T family DNA segregation ATPase FtsK/SpoIIIE
MSGAPVIASMRAVLAWALIAIALFLALAFSTYHTEPVELLGGRIANLGGPVGQAASGVLVGAFGVGAYLFCFELVLLGAVLLSRPVRPPHALMLAGLFVAMLTFGALCQALLPGRNFPGGSAPLGGLLGLEVCTRLQGLLGPMWTFVTLAVGTLAGVLLAGDHLLIEVLQGQAPRRGTGRGTRAGAPMGLLGLLRRRLGDVLGPDPEPAPEDAALVEADLAAVRAIEGARRKRRQGSPGAAPARSGAAEPGPAEPRGRRAAPEEAEEDEAFAAEYAMEDLDPAGEEEDEPAEPSRQDGKVPSEISPPRIREAAAPLALEEIEVIRLARDPKLRGKEKYQLPGINLLQEPVYLEERESDEEIQAKAAALEMALLDFGVTAKVEEIVRGPVITRFEMSIARGTKISKVTGLADELAMALGVPRVRIAPVKGKSVLGAEIPNRERETVFLRELIMASDLRRGRVTIPLFLGKDVAGQPVIEDLATTPHLLIAGRTGAGKSVFVNNIVLSILLTRYPEEVRLIMIDPKKVELEVYQEIPHLLTKVESHPKRAAKILEWAVNHMEERYELLAITGVRHLSSYNKLGRTARIEKLSKAMSAEEAERQPDHLPYIVIIVDELADLMMVAGKEVEQSIARLAQKARAVGIHVVLATQRPSTDVITGLIKSNLPARIAFQTRTGIDSRTILDRYGAEKLLDRGDMLYLGATSDDPRRIQGPFVSDAEVERVVGYLREHASSQYTHHLEQVSAPETAGGAPSERDDLFDQAVELVLSSGQASASYLQTRMQIGYARARRLIDLMGEAGIVSQHRGSKAREILVTLEQWEEMRNKTAEASSG